MLVIWYGQQRVGELARGTQRLLAFRYDDYWLDAPDSFPLSPRLPLTDAPSVGDEPLFFFSNLLPEGPLLRTLCKLRRLPETDTFAQLAAFGAEAAGAFSILKDGERPSKEQWKYKRYTDAELARDLERARKGLLPLFALHDELRLSLAGAQDKLPVHYDQGKLYLPMNGAPSTHILKPPLQPASEFSSSIENEGLCVMLAQEALSENGDRIAEEAAVIERSDEKLLLVRRFDRAKENDHWKRLHQLDFCQLAGVLPDQKYEKDGGPGLSRVFGLIEEWSVLPAVDRLRAVDWVIYNFLIGNADAHAKNLAMMPAGAGLYHLAPFYDLLSTGLYARLTDRLAMKIGGEDRPDWVRAANWAKFADEVKVNKTLLRDRAGQASERCLGKLGDVAERLNIRTTRRLVRHVRQTIEKRARMAARMAG